jgi:hypothetical protein
METGKGPRRPGGRAEWRERTDAEICTESQFADRKSAGRLHVVGVLGFAGRWERSGLRGEALAGFIAEARQALQAELLRCQAAHAERLVVSTGATNTGVLQLTYEVCSAFRIRTMSVAPDRALNYELGPLDYLIPLGNYFGDESDAFVRLCDEFVLLGGGKQSHREILAGHQAGKPVTVIQGFGGIADELGPADLPNARWV